MSTADPVADSEGVDAIRLYVALGRISRSVRRDAPAGQVGHGALSVLATLSADGPQRLGTLAALEGVSPPSLTRIVAALEDLGHVRRTTDPEDGRVCIVTATESGKDLVVAGRAGRLAGLAARIERLDPEARRALAAAVPALERLGQDD